ncbi:Glucose--fructose oxidoreductase precursor [Shimia sp. SK013]|uniref:Gfo/Idh/MocA family protein n=1 Tax=Shimia sp. SK013 TaxID=1389006 RepID=UPI0006B57FBC|nr:Gfo/Idh/MocA family oxidoreductase [Shimia sp. SK013]KPA23211.1 Glucose--fructose oxidoreductase precursor [Shimia sp. SK013]
MITVAIIGAGIGREHLNGYLALPDLYRVKTLCDLDEARARSVLDEIDGDTRSITVSSDMQSVLTDADVDLIDVCLPPHLHFPVSRDAMLAGKHVVCEKPLVPSLADADALIDIATDTNRILSPVFQYRFGPAMSQLQALQDAGLTGAAYAASLETHWNRDAAYYAVPWRGTWEGENGGAVLGHAIHNHDLLTTIMGPIESLSATTNTLVNAIEVEDCAAISFRMQSGGVATSSITLGAATDTSRLRIVFEKLTAESGSAPYAPATETWTFTARDPADQAQVDAIVASVGAVRAGFAGYFAELANHINGAPHRAVTLEDGRRSIELVAAIYQSAREGRAITLPLGRSTPLYQSWAPA